NLILLSPVIEVVGVTDVVYEKDLNITVNANDVDGNKLESVVMINGTNIDSSTGTDYGIEINEGNNSIQVQTTDQYGNTTTKEFEVEYVVEPVIEIGVSGLDESNIVDGSLSFTVHISSNQEGETPTPTVTNNGKEVTGDGENFTLNLDEGSTVIEVSVEDETGNITRKQKGKTPTPTITNKGKEVTGDEENFTLNLDEGSNVIEVSVEDETGNITTQSYTIEYTLEDEDDEDEKDESKENETEDDSNEDNENNSDEENDEETEDESDKEESDNEEESTEEQEDDKPEEDESDQEDSEDNQ